MIKARKSVIIGGVFIFLLLGMGMILLAERKKEKTTATYTNPLPVKFGDPYVLMASDGKYYMYGTDEKGTLDGFEAYSSDNLVDWTPEGQVYKGSTENSWASSRFWAPEVYERDGKYFMLFSADWKYNPAREAENFRIGVAVADKPTGPFREMSDKPLFDPGYPVIDANVLEFKGKTYLYYSRCCYKNPVESEVAEWAKQLKMFDEIEESWIYGVEIKSDFSEIIGEPKLLLQPPRQMNNSQSEWESRSVTSGEVNRRWMGAPFTMVNKDNDKIYMMYSANFFGGENYAIGYATSKNPLGPFKKATNNPILERNTARNGIVLGCGHNSVTWSKDGRKMYCIYYGRTAKTGDNRVVFIDEMRVDKDGALFVDGPTTDPRTVVVE